MKCSKILEIKVACHKAQKTIEGADCGACPLTGKINLKVPVQSFGVWERGDIVLPVNPCLLLEEIAENIKKAKA